MEILALELRSGLDALGQIIGETTPDDVLENIFSRFCLGK
jgi:tRNA modification GTPase